MRTRLTRRSTSSKGLGGAAGGAGTSRTGTRIAPECRRLEKYAGERICCAPQSSSPSGDEVFAFVEDARKASLGRERGERRADLAGACWGREHVRTRMRSMVREYEYTWKIVAHEPPSRMTVESTRNRKERLKKPRKTRWTPVAFWAIVSSPLLRRRNGAQDRIR